MSLFSHKKSDPSSHPMSDHDRRLIADPAYAEIVRRLQDVASRCEGLSVPLLSGPGTTAGKPTPIRDFIAAIFGSEHKGAPQLRVRVGIQAGLADDELRSLVADLSLALDDLYRHLGGDGLKVADAQASKVK